MVGHPFLCRGSGGGEAGWTTEENEVEGQGEGDSHAAENTGRLAEDSLRRLNADPQAKRSRAWMASGRHWSTTTILN